MPSTAVAMSIPAYNGEGGVPVCTGRGCVSQNSLGTRGVGQGSVSQHALGRGECLPRGYLSRGVSAQGVVCIPACTGADTQLGEQNDSQVSKHYFAVGDKN